MEVVLISLQIIKTILFHFLQDHKMIKDISLQHWMGRGVLGPLASIHILANQCQIPQVQLKFKIV